MPPCDSICGRLNLGVCRFCGGAKYGGSWDAAFELIRASAGIRGAFFRHSLAAQLISIDFSQAGIESS